MKNDVKSERAVRKEKCAPSHRKLQRDALTVRPQERKIRQDAPTRPSLFAAIFNVRREIWQQSSYRRNFHGADFGTGL